MQKFENGDYVKGIDPITLKEWTGKIVTRIDGKQVVLNESKTWKYVTDLYGLKLLDEADTTQQISTFNDYVNNKIGTAIDNGTNFEKIKPEDMKKLSKSFFDATKRNHDIKERPSSQDEAEKVTQNAITAKTIEKQNGDDVAAKEAEKNIEEITSKLREKLYRSLNPNARKLVEMNQILPKEKSLKEDCNGLYEYLRRSFWGSGEFRACNSAEDIANIIFARGMDNGYSDNEVYDAARWFFEDINEEE